MRLSRSTWLKVLATALIALGIVLAYQAGTMDSHGALRSRVGAGPSAPVTPGASLTFTATAYSVSLTRTSTTSINWPMACITPATCADLQASYLATANVQSATCTGTTLCTCVVTSTTPAAVSEQGTYTTSGSTITTTPSGGTPASGGFCVQGDTGHFMNLEMTGQMRPTSDQVAQRLAL